jgi:hypothetical protein
LVLPDDNVTYFLNEDARPTVHEGPEEGQHYHSFRLQYEGDTDAQRLEVLDYNQSANANGGMSLFARVSTPPPPRAARLVFRSQIPLPSSRRVYPPLCDSLLHTPGPVSLPRSVLTLIPPSHAHSSGS